MKTKLLLAFLLLATLQTNAQNLIPYRDSVSHFSIGIPEGWFYSQPKDKPGIRVYAYRFAQSRVDTPRENINVNVYKSVHNNLNDAFADLVSALKKSKDFRMASTGTQTIHGKTFRWIIETHSLKGQPALLCTCDFMTFQDNQCYVLTMMTTAANFNKYKPLFQKIAGSFHVD